VILVTGAAGKTGRAVISALVARGHSVRALVHSEAQGETFSSTKEVEVFVGDLLSKDTVGRAVRGVEGVYHICPNVDPNELSIGNIMISAARAAEVKLFVFHSVLHPQVESMPHHWLKMRVEETLFNSEIPFAIMQPAPYMQNILPELSDIENQGIYSVPYSVEAPFSPVDLSDVAEAAANVLSESASTGGIYELAGPEVLTPRQVASTLERILGRDVRAEKISIDAWKKRASSLGSYQKDTLAKMFEYYDLHGLWGNPRVLKDLIQRQPATFEIFARRSHVSAHE
jgi:uncharacterized protein YbjT (DUF2867 family)